MGALGAAFGTKYLSVKLLHVVASASGVIGSLMYGLTSAGWMVIVARMLQVQIPCHIEILHVIDIIIVKYSIYLAYTTNPFETIDKQGCVN